MSHEPNGVRYERTITEFQVFADDISLYPQMEGAMYGKLTYGGKDKAEQKFLPIKLRHIQTDGVHGLRGRKPQLVIELCGDYHIEELQYPTIKPSEWYSYGKIWFSKEEVKGLIERLQYIYNEMGD